MNRQAMADTNALFDTLKGLSKDDAKQLEEKLRAKMPKSDKAAEADAPAESAEDSADAESES